MKTKPSLRALLGLDRAGSLSFGILERLRDRDLCDLGLDRRAIRDLTFGTPAEVPNDRV